MKHILQTAISTLALGAATLAMADRTSTDEIQQRFASNATEATMDEVIGDGYRLIDLEITSTNPLRFGGAFVKNTGSYKKDWWWTANKSHEGMEEFIKDHNARPIDIEINTVDGKKRYAGTFIKNAGDDKVDWMAFEELDFDQLKKKQDEYDGRIIDLDVRSTKDGRRFSGVMIKNTGNFKKGHVFFSNKSASEIKKMASDNKMQLVDIERIDDDSFAGVLESNPGAPWWFLVGRTWEQLQQDQAQFNSRVIDIERVEVNGKARYDYILINNCNPLETRVGEMLRDGANGVRGFYLRQIGGDVLAKLLPDYRFYPASSIKMLEHMYWTYQVDKKGLAQNTNIKIYTNHTNDTHPNSDTFTLQSLIQTQQSMMFNSSNVAANALQDAAANGDGAKGRAAIMKFAKDILGLDDDIQLNHKLADGGISNDPHNMMTGRESGLMMEKAVDGSVYSANGFTYLHDNMLNETNNSGLSSGLRGVVNQEGQKLGLSNSEINDYWSRVRLMWKGGNNGTAQITSVAYAVLPFKSGNRIGSKRYVMCAFVEGSTTNTFGTGGASGTILPELLRDTVRDGLKGWK